MNILTQLFSGKLYNVVSQKTLMQSMESVAQKIMVPGVSISFEKYGPDPDPIPKEGKFSISEYTYQLVLRV